MGMGMVVRREVGWEGRGPREKPTYDEVLRDTQEKQQQHYSSQSVSCRPSERIPLSSVPPVSFSASLLVSPVFIFTKRKSVLSR